MVRNQLAPGLALPLLALSIGCAEEPGATAAVPDAAAPQVSVSAPSASVPSALVSAAPVPAWEGPARPDAPLPEDALPKTLEAQREALFTRIEAWHDPGPDAMGKLRGVFTASSILGQGNPRHTAPAMTRAACLERRAAASEISPGSRACGARNMVPLYNPKPGQTAADARQCIDQFEFPNIPCEYPVVLPRSKEAHELCQAVGKRLCDAHEWEGGCAGALLPVEDEYAFGKERKMMRYLHNRGREEVWAYGEKKDHSKCATGSRKSKKCYASGYRQCGTNSYPAGSFPECVSSLGVYDQHGNAAEHMNLPLTSSQLTSRGGTGQTEMKGSWFIFGSYEAHVDDCRWRAPNWHGGPVMASDSHRNFHLGFRCCKDI